MFFKPVRCLLIGVFLVQSVFAQTTSRQTENFNSNWKFNLGDVPEAKDAAFSDANWRSLNLPHDWSIEGKFDEKNPAGFGGGALPGGIGWYRKSFTLPASAQNKQYFIDFEGVYCNSEVWINGHYLGLRPNGYISFRYNLTPYVHFGTQKNVLVVKVNNSNQPNSRWYSGSGIYRNVFLVSTNKISVEHWGTQVTTPQVSVQTATVNIKTTVKTALAGNVAVQLKTSITDAAGKIVAQNTSYVQNISHSSLQVTQNLQVGQPQLWSDKDPYLYQVKTQVISQGKVVDDYETSLGIRYFNFDAKEGFSLNGKHLKIRGVCNHHDLGALGAAFNVRAAQRQLEILKEMGCNAIRTSHNPPAPELLDLCDKMGFLVMDEAFDMWKKEKSKFDYHLVWDQWHRKDLEDQLKRDRNHPSVIIWSIGNEIPEQGDSTGKRIAAELASIVKSMDTTRPITAALNEPNPKNQIYESGAVDLVGFNYHHQNWASFPTDFPDKKMIVTESTSALETRGHYDTPSDSIRRWPKRWDEVFKDGSPDLTVSAYDNVSAPWGSTHEESLKELKRLDFVSGMFIWTGFDYLGEPTPYVWPAKSSYFGVIDLAGFPKDVYYLYQSEWTDKPVLHILPHWNWTKGKVVDVVAYYNQADEVELFLNGKSQGIKKKTGDAMHVMWRLPFEAGTLKAVSRKNGNVVLTKEISTAGKAAKIVLSVDRNAIKADGNDLSYVTVKIMDDKGNLVPDADNLVTFSVAGKGVLKAVDNGSETSHESFQADNRKAFNGLALAIVQAAAQPGKAVLTAKAGGLQEASVIINVQ